MSWFPSLKRVSSRFALKMPAEPGIKTLVRQDDGPENTAPDDVKEQALPLPGSATPGGEGRDIPKFEFNTPDSDSNIQPRTLAEPGEDRGHPVNETYTHVERRTMTSRDITSSWARLKRFFGVRSPLFHATTGPRAANIALDHQGIKANSGLSNFGLGNVGSVSLSRNLDFLLRGNFGNMIFVLDGDLLRRKFPVKPLAYSNWEDEFEERVQTDHIPFSMIRGVIFRYAPRKFELEEWSSLVNFPLVYQNKREGGGWVRFESPTSQTKSLAAAGVARPILVWDPDEAENDPWKLAKSVGVNILSNKEFRAGYVVDGQMVAALFDEVNQDGYEFDIVVDPAWQNKRFGSKLMDIAIDQYDEMSEAYGDDFTFNLDIINPLAVRMLKQRGFVETGREHGHVLMTKRARWQQRWRPGKRQRRQRGKARVKSKLYFRQNRAKILRKQRIRRSRGSYKNNPARKRSEMRRQRQNRHRIGASLSVTPCPGCVASRYLEAATSVRFNPPRERGGEDGKAQRKQPLSERRDDARYYRTHRSKIKRRNQIFYKLRCVHNHNCLKRREKYRENPEFYKRKTPASKTGSVLTVPDIAFVLGPEMTLGYVDSISPMTGMVTFRMDEVNVSQLNSMPVEVFLRAVTLLSDEDIDAFFELVDVEIGLEAYGDLDEEGLRECAGLYGLDPNSEDFKVQCFELVGEEDISSMSVDQMEAVNDELVVGIREEGGSPRNTGDGEEADGLDETISDLWDPHLFYGEVESQKTLNEEDGTWHFVESLPKKVF